MKLACLTAVGISFPPLKQACWQGSRLLTRLKSKCRFHVQIGEQVCNHLLELMTTVLLLHRNASSRSEKMFIWRLLQTSGDDMNLPNFICNFQPSLQSLFDSVGFCLLNPCNVLPSSHALECRRTAYSFKPRLKSLSFQFPCSFKKTKSWRVCFWANKTRHAAQSFWMSSATQNRRVQPERFWPCSCDFVKLLRQDVAKMSKDPS